MSPDLSLPTGAPISDSLKRHIDEALSKIITGKSVYIGGGIAMTGVRVEGGIRRGPITVGGYAGRLWGGQWEAGVTGGLLW